MSCGKGVERRVESREYGRSFKERSWRSGVGASGVPGFVGERLVGEPGKGGTGEVGIWRVSGEVGSDVDVSGAGRGSKVVGEGLMKREISSGVLSGVTFSTRVQEGMRRTVVGWDFSELPWWWGGCMFDAEIINRYSSHS